MKASEYVFLLLNLERGEIITESLINKIVEKMQKVEPFTK